MKEHIPFLRLTSKKELNEVEISHLPNKEFKVMIIKMLTKFRRRMEEHSENFNKELENIKRNQTELKNTITTLKNTVEGLNSRLDGVEEQINDWEDRAVKLTQTEEQKEKGILKS